MNKCTMQRMQLHQEVALQLSYDEELVAEMEVRRRKTFSSSWHQSNVRRLDWPGVSILGSLHKHL